MTQDDDMVLFMRTQKFHIQENETIALSAGMKLKKEHRLILNFGYPGLIMAEVTYFNKIDSIY